MWLRIYILIALAALVVTGGCQGKIQLGDAGSDGIAQADGLDGYDAGSDSVGDPGQDASDQSGDLQPDAGDICTPDCAGKQCGSNGCGGECGQCSGSAVCVDFQCQEPGPCDNVTCTDLEWCKDGICRCQSGWLRQGAECVPLIPVAFGDRSPQSVCDKWNTDYPNLATWVWEAGPETCDNGSLNPESIDDAIRRINLFRWLVDLYPVYNMRSQNVYAQPCAVMINVNGDLDHSPPTDWECYSSEGAAGAGHSNLAMGPRDPAGAIDLYIRDNRVPSLGHRRWIFDPPYLPTGIGHSAQWNCTYVMTGGNSYRPDWLAYPPPGPCPRAAILGNWSLGAPGYDQDTVLVTVTDLTTSDEQQPSFYFPSGGYGSYSYLAYTMSGITAGHDYEVTIDGVKLGGYNDPPETISYTVQVVDCSEY